VLDAYADAPRPAVGAYSSDGQAPMSIDEVRDLVAQAFSEPS
jgi:hypothetical protein